MSGLCAHFRRAVDDNRQIRPLAGHNLACALYRLYRGFEHGRAGILKVQLQKVRYCRSFHRIFRQVADERQKARRKAASFYNIIVARSKSPQGETTQNKLHLLTACFFRF